MAQAHSTLFDSAIKGRNFGTSTTYFDREGDDDLLCRDIDCFLVADYRVVLPNSASCRLTVWYRYLTGFGA